MKLRAITVPPYDVDKSSGYDEAPAAYMRAGLYDRLRGAGIGLTGPIAVPPPAEQSEDAVTTIAHLGANIATAVAAALREEGNVLVTGSNCNALVGVLAGFERRYGATAKIGLVWFDAHGDFNTPKTTLSGMIGGMPVAVSAGLAFPHWRAITGLDAPIPTDRIVMVDVRNLDPKERTLIEATDVTIEAIEPGRPGVPMREAIDALAATCDVIYLHIDEDVLDERYVPNHGTVEPNGPDMDAVLDAIRLVLDTGKVHGYGLVSVNVRGEGGGESLASALQLLTVGLTAWHKGSVTEA
ncbi:MAG: arginase family protein [Chloroflexota bacterium]|nr:arginase family protein [Chloroflexota bacterium]